MSKSKRQREDPCYICGHYHDYERGERCGVCGHVLQQSGLNEEHSAMPTQILPGFLYVGSYDHASRLELLKAMGITHVLSLVPSCQELYKNTLTYHTVASNPADLQECFTYIDKVRSEQKRVVVHCMTGIAKSPAVVVAYLMKLRGWSLKESYVWVKDRHKAAEPSQADTERLRSLEVQLLGRSSTGFQALPNGGRHAGASGCQNHPFQPGWADAGPAGKDMMQSATPQLSFPHTPLEVQRNFTFGAASRTGIVQQPDTGQAAMDV